MNCKQNDLAWVVRSYAGNEGKIVRCVVHEPVRYGSGPLVALGRMLAWRIDPPMPGCDGLTCTHVPDDHLRPIRDNDGVDEVLQLVGKPQPTREVA